MENTTGAHGPWPLYDRRGEGVEGRGMRFLIATLITCLIASPTAAGWLDGYIDPEEWAFYIQVGQAWGR